MILFLIASGAALGSMDVTPSPILQECSFPGSAKIVLEANDLPTEIKASLDNTIGRMAPRDAPFQESDVIRDESLPITRFIGGILDRNDWVLLYERGIRHQIRAIRYYARYTAGSNRKLGTPINLLRSGDGGLTRSRATSLAV